MQGTLVQRGHHAADSCADDKADKGRRGLAAWYTGMSNTSTALAPKLGMSCIAPNRPSFEVLSSTSSDACWVCSQQQRLANVSHDDRQSVSGLGHVAYFAKWCALQVRPATTDLTSGSVRAGDK